MRNPKPLFSDGNADAVLIVGEINKFYFTDFVSENSILLLLPDRAFFFTDKRYTEAATELLEGKDKENASGRSAEFLKNGAEYRAFPRTELSKSGNADMAFTEAEIKRAQAELSKNGIADREYDKAKLQKSVSADRAFTKTEFLKNDENFPCKVVDITGENPFDTVKEILAREKAAKVGFENATVTYADYLIFETLGAALVPVSERISAMRRVKSGYEIERTAKAAEITENTLVKITESLKEGMTERDVADEIFSRMRMLGADGVSFEPIVAFDANTSRPHHAYGGAKLKKGSVVTVDLGAKYKGYCGDMTRSFAFGSRRDGGSLEYEKIYGAVLDAQKTALDFLNGEMIKNRRVFAKDADTAARNVIENRGFGRFFTHSLGHSVGLEIHEEPRLSQKSAAALSLGDVVTVEPGVYLENRFGVRIEDMVLLTESGVRNFYTMSKELIFL
ncbi:MAG: aminopeptidase P family protein [Clostridiales bacterium]|jgi:Xaa-Pro aminopeptidase|nr:aminopeptidase P family protein [Clostridiales bacterium]